jgi:hypothetical protein
MKKEVKYCVFFNKDGDATSFVLVNSIPTPVSNFELALKWFKERSLNGASCNNMILLLSDSGFIKKNKTLLGKIA